MGNLLSTYTPTQKHLMLELLFRSIREHGISVVVDTLNTIIRLGDFLGTHFDHLGLNNVPSSPRQSMAGIQTYCLDQILQVRNVPAGAGTRTASEELSALLHVARELEALPGITSQIINRSSGSTSANQWPPPISSTFLFTPQLMGISPIAIATPYASRSLLSANGRNIALSNSHGARYWWREPVPKAEIPLRLDYGIKRDLAAAFDSEGESVKLEDAPPTKKIMAFKQDADFSMLNSMITGESAMSVTDRKPPLPNFSAVVQLSRDRMSAERLCGEESECIPSLKKFSTEKTFEINAPEVGGNQYQRAIGTKWVHLTSCASAESQSIREGSTIGYKGIMILSWEMIDAILKFLPREHWKGLALSCKHFRVVLSSMALREEKVVIPTFESPAHWKLHFITLNSFKMLNRHWRLGPLFQPINRITFSVPYDDDERAICLQLVLDYFRSLRPDVKHVEHVFLNLGYVWDKGDMASGMNFELIRDLLREVHRSSCSRLTLMSVDIPDQSGKEEPASDILLNLHDRKLDLESLSVESIAFSHPMILPWIMRQVVENSTIKHLRLSGTGFIGIQLDNILCYFDLPRLESLTIGGPWLASVLELLQGSPRVHTIHFQDLSDLRVQDGSFVSLPNLRSIRGNATILHRFIPLLRDVSWKSFGELEIDVNVERGSDDSTVEILDVESCIKVFNELVYKNAELDTLAISFPRLDGFSLPLFDKVEELHGTMHALKVSHLQIQLRCETEREIGEVMEGMVPLFSAIRSVQTLFVHSIAAQIAVLDKFAFVASFGALRPDVLVKFL